MILEKITSEIPSFIQKSVFRFPIFLPIITARIIRTAVSVRMVPPTVIATAWFFETPNLLTIGYAKSVWVANILAVKKLALKLYPKR